MDLGRIVQFGPAHELYNRPADVFVARLLGPTNLLQGQVDSQSGDLRGEMIVRTPLGRLIARSTPERPGQGAPVTISIRPETLTASIDGARRLESVPGDRRADRLPRRAPPDPRPRARATGRS